ncbi:MAG TPA: pitrilysin family protein [Thermomicrobiales bacterium]|nr:pitrilysin family protein [Thermomicrobiales bacterium]
MSETSAVIQHTLANGLGVLLKEDRSAPLVSTWTWYRVGSRNETPGLTGISHWVEHMQFKGTPRLAKGQIFRDVSRHGGVLNAMTSHDWTAYYETLPAANLDLVLRIEPDRMANSLFDPAETESERTVILSELQGAENSPAYLLYKEVTGAAFREHPYRHMVIGYENDLRQIARDELYAHYRTFYQPGNAFFVAVGDFAADDAMAKIDAAFGAIPPAPPPPTVRIVEPAQIAEQRVLLRRPSPTAYVRMAFHAPDGRDPDAAALLVADAVLSGGKGMGLGGGGPMGRSSRLYRSLVDAGLARSAGSDFDLTLDPYLFSIGVTALERVGPERIEPVIDAEIDRLRHERVPADELERARKQVKAQYVYSLEGVTNQAFWLGQMEIVNTWRRVDALMNEVETVTADDVRRAVDRNLRPERRTVGWLVPDGAGGGSNGAADPGAARFTRWAVSGGAQPNRAGFERDVLSDGTVVLGQARPGEPSVSVRLRVDAGALADPADQAGLAAMTSRMLTRGTASKTAVEINETTDALGSSIGADAGRHSAELSFRCLAEDLPTMLALAGDMLRNPSFPDDELAKVRAQMLTGILQADDDTRATADRVMRRLAFPPPNPLGRRVSGDIASVSALARDDLVRFHRQRYAPGSVTAAIVGGVPSFAAARDLVATAFADWGGSAAAPIDVPAPPPRSSLARETATIPGKSQADVAFGYPTISRLDPAYYALDLANLVLGRLGLMGRLGATVRDRHGLAYYVFSQLEAGREGSLWVSRAGVDPTNVARAIDGVVEELRLLRQAGVTPEELADAKSYLIGVLPLALETNDGVASMLLAIEYYGLGLDYVDRYPSLIGGVTANAVIDAARLIDPDALVIGVARPANGSG